MRSFFTASKGELNKMYGLHGKTALVTGAGGKNGIGRAAALRLAEEGADVVVSDICERPRTEDSWGGLSALVDDIRGMGRKSFSVVGDVSLASDVSKIIESVVSVFDSIDILVANAGAPAGDDRVPVVELEEKNWDLVIDVNLKGTFLCCQAAARKMIARGNGGKIITLSSSSGKVGRPRFAAYCASKFAIRGFTQSLAQELGEYGITVNAICPGIIETERTRDMAAALRPKGISVDEQLSAMIEKGKVNTPLGRSGNGEDVAKAIAFLSSSEAAYLTGVSMMVTGGLEMD